MTTAMLGGIQLVLGAVGLSVIITYAVWCRARIWIYRQDLFAIRDAMWDAALEGGFLDDPHHRYAREAMNRMIRFAPRLHIVTAGMAARRTKHTDPMPEGPMPEAVREAWVKAAKRTLRYLIFESASGWALLGVWLVRRRVSLWKRRVEGFVNKLFRSKDIDHMASPQAHG